MEVEGVGRYRLLGETRDDAAGEAFDKSAKLLGLAYPGGPALAVLAEQGQPGRFTFPRPMLDRLGLEFSFSGLKTAVALAVRAHPLNDQLRADIARAVQDAIVEVLVVKSMRALAQLHLGALVVSGGVGANRELRARLESSAAKLGARVFFPRLEFCTDNAAMIAIAGLLRFKHGASGDLAIAARARWPLEELTPVVAAV
jgi:N6-L-threonylcarbamoyladenine synthase